MKPRLLDDELLDRFEARLRKAGAAVVENWAPGLTDAQIDELLVPLGIDLPEEARRWWRWHDGALRVAPAPTEISPGRVHLPLRYAAGEYAAARDEMPELYGMEGLLSPVSDLPAVCFHCVVPRDAPVPIYILGDWVADPELVLPSIGELVEVWIGLIDRGVWTTAADGRWEWDHERLPPDVLEFGIY